MGFRRILSDWYWLRAVQYYGTAANEASFFSGLYPLLDRATDLDPTFQYLYVFGGECIPYHEYKVGWHNTAHAMQLLSKAMANDPQRWEIPWVYAYNLYTFAGKYREAGQMMEIAADLAARGQRADERFAPPTYLRTFAPRLLAQGGDLETAIEFTAAAAARAQDESLKAELEDRLRALRLERELQILNDALAAAAGRGIEVKALSDLALPDGTPISRTDPYGDPYVLDSQNARVESKNSTHLLRLYVNPSSTGAGERAVD
jgi:hypothetical protein